MVLCKLADDHFGIEPDHRPLRGSAPATAPAAAASLISLIVAGRRRDLTMPRKIEAGRFGKRTTLPVRMQEKLDQIAWIQPEMLPDSFWNCRWPFVVIADCTIRLHYII